MRRPFSVASVVVVTGTKWVADANKRSAQWNASPEAKPKLIITRIWRSDGPVADRSKSRQRSRVTNGTALLPGVDGRSAWMRRCKDIIAAHVSDLGGEDNISAAERSIIRRASVMTVELERLEAKFAAAGEASERDLDLYIRAAGNLRRLLETIGLKRRPRDVGPTLGDLLREEDEGAAP
jgi:hypothetical protein